MYAFNTAMAVQELTRMSSSVRTGTSVVSSRSKFFAEKLIVEQCTRMSISERAWMPVVFRNNEFAVRKLMSKN